MSFCAGIGWNMNYPFSTGDLLCAGQTASSYLDNNTKVCAFTCCGAELAFWHACICLPHA